MAKNAKKSRQKSPSKDDLMKSANALATVHQLLSQGMFQGFGAKDVVLSLEFIQTLHQQVMSELEPMLEKEAAAEVQAKDEK